MAHQVSLLQHLGDQVVYLVTHNKTRYDDPTEAVENNLPVADEVAGQGRTIVRTDATPAPRCRSTVCMPLLSTASHSIFHCIKAKSALVNTASGMRLYGQQLATLEKLFQTYADRLQVLAFPSNDFKQQEKGSDADIASFCKKNYGLSFPVMKKRW